MARRVLLGCGIVSSLLYVAANIVGSRRWRDYSLTSQTVSELSAIGAPSRALVIPLLAAHGALVIPFGFGVWESAGRGRALRVAGALLVGLGASDLPAPVFAMHRREALARGERSRTDTMHIIVTIVNSVLILLAMRLRLGFRKAVSPLLDRDDPGARGDWWFDRYAGVAGGGQPADAVGGGDGAHQHRRLPALAGGAGHRSLARASAWSASVACLVVCAHGACSPPRPDPRRVAGETLASRRRPHLTIGLPPPHFPSRTPRPPGGIGRLLCRSPR
jgi:hypothetical protein